MEQAAWDKFAKARERLKQAVKEIEKKAPRLKDAQKKLIEGRGGGGYPLDTPVVYNSSLDAVSPSDDIRLILVADNPGRREQALENRSYLVGPSGKIARNFFSSNGELGIDFCKNVIILNKTPIHTGRTGELRQLCRADSQIKEAAEESQILMARSLLEFHSCFRLQNGESVPVWIIGYCEMKKNGIFQTFTEELKELYKADSLRQMYESILLFRHFSMNQFTADLKKQAEAGETAGETLSRIGAAYRRRILGQ